MKRSKFCEEVQTIFFPTRTKNYKRYEKLNRNLHVNSLSQWIFNNGANINQTCKVSGWKKVMNLRRKRFVSLQSFWHNVHVAALLKRDRASFMLHHLSPIQVPLTDNKRQKVLLLRRRKAQSNKYAETSGTCILRNRVTNQIRQYTDQIHFIRCI